MSSDSGPHPLFSDSWAAAWREEINRSEAYRAAAADWEDPVVLQAGDLAVCVDLVHGECRRAAPAGEDDTARVPFIIAASAAVWRELLGGRLDPLVAIMMGRLRLVKGSLGQLMPHATAAKEMVKAAARVPTLWPDR